MQSMCGVLILCNRGAVLGGSEDPSPEDQKRLTERAQRFGKQGTTEGNKNFKKKISIDELLKRNQVYLPSMFVNTESFLFLACWRR